MRFGLNTKDNNLNYSYYNNDYLGTPKQLTDSKGTTVWQAHYKSFGDALVVNNIVTNNLRFPGQYFDGETGLHQNYFRDYNPSLGRYIETDPIGMDGGVNNYGYVGGIQLITLILKV